MKLTGASVKVNLLWNVIKGWKFPNLKSMETTLNKVVNSRYRKFGIEESRTFCSTPARIRFIDKASSSYGSERNMR